MARLLTALDNRVVELDVPATGLPLEQMQKLVGGYIEFVLLAHHPRCHALIVNEEGMLKQLPFNARASMLARQTIVGDVIECIIENAGEDDERII